MRAAALLLLAACHRGAPCDDLSGIAHDGSGREWMILDGGDALAVYPLFPDAPAIAGLEVAPRWIALARDGDHVLGEVARRFGKGATFCEGRAPAHVVGCTRDALEITLADPDPPVSFVPPCAWGTPPPPHAEHWTRGE
ncbi:MAG TPA: hypothetical protein VGM88_28500 [Kofleriaceae bacterium]|jgi:hypothetical protein